MGLLGVIFLCLMSFSAPEVNNGQDSKSTETKASGTKKSTDMSFDELLVQGKYHFTDEAVTTVEQDKVLDGLLQVRKDFKDRIQQSAARY